MVIGYNIAEKKFYYVKYTKGGIYYNIVHESGRFDGIKISYTYVNEKNMRKDWVLPPSVSAP